MLPTVALADSGAKQALPTDLSIWGMFAQADWVVKLVIIGLLLASLATWSVFIAKLLDLKKRKKQAQDLRSILENTASLSDLSDNASKAPLVIEAKAEIAQSRDALADHDGLKERIVSRFDRYEAALARRLTQGVTVLATIGAIAPFVGLFGTVWGIMNAFIGIAEKQTTNLAVVAPGIAEALLATALGLVAAIPAVVIYNHFARQIAAHRAIVSDSAAALLRIISRDLSANRLTTDKAEG